MSVVGSPLTRVDGRAKVTGTAKFSAEFEIPQLAYAVMVTSTIASGQVNGMDTSAAERVPGVLAVITPRNVLKLPGAERRITVLQDTNVYYQNQPVAVVVAETLEQAQHAAQLVRVRYDAKPAKLDFEAGFPSSYPGEHNGEPGDAGWGDVNAGLAQAE